MQYLSLHDFVRTYRPISDVRKAVMPALRKIDVASERWPDILPQLHQLGIGPAERNIARSIFIFWDETVRQRGVTKLAAPRPEPKPKGALPAVATFRLTEPVEIDVDGSRLLAPAQAISWIKQIDKDKVLVALSTGETLIADNTLGELRDQLSRHITPTCAERTPNNDHA